MRLLTIGAAIGGAMHGATALPQAPVEPETHPISFPPQIEIETDPVRLHLGASEHPASRQLLERIDLTVAGQYEFTQPDGTVLQYQGEHACYGGKGPVLTAPQILPGTVAANCSDASANFSLVEPEDYRLFDEMAFVKLQDPAVRCESFGSVGSKGYEAYRRPVVVYDKVETSEPCDKGGDIVMGVFIGLGALTAATTALMCVSLRREFRQDQQASQAHADFLARIAQRTAQVESKQHGEQIELA